MGSHARLSKTLRCQQLQCASWSARIYQRRLACLAYAALISAWSCPEQVFSQAPASLRWEAAAGCPDAAAGRRAIDDLLEPRGLHGAWRAEVTVTIAQRADLRWQAQVAIRDAEGVTERRLDGAKCSSVAGAAALVAAMALETIAASERVATERAVSAPSHSVAASPAAAGAASHDEAFAVTVGARAVFDAGSLPLPSAGVGPVLGFQFGAWRLAADATFWLPRLASGPDSGSEAQICLLSAALHGCYLALQVAEQLGLEPCVAVEAGVARGHGVNVLDIAHPSAPWAAVFAGSDAPRSTSLGRFRERKLPGRDTNGGWGHTWHGDTAQQWSTQIRSVRRTPNRTCRSRAQNSRASILNTSALYGGCCRAWVCLQAW